MLRWQAAHIAIPLLTTRPTLRIIVEPRGFSPLFFYSALFDCKSLLPSWPRTTVRLVWPGVGVVTSSSTVGCADL